MHSKCMDEITYSCPTLNGVLSPLNLGDGWLSTTRWKYIRNFSSVAWPELIQISKIPVYASSYNKWLLTVHHKKHQAARIHQGWNMFDMWQVTGPAGSTSEECWARRRHQVEEQVITSHRYCGRNWLIPAALDTRALSQYKDRLIYVWRFPC